MTAHEYNHLLPFTAALRIAAPHGFELRRSEVCRSPKTPFHGVRNLIRNCWC